MYEIVLSTRFKKDLKKIVKKNPILKSRIRKQIEILSFNPQHKSLRVHKLSGAYTWSLSITMDIRVIFSIRGSRILCTRIGTHKEVYQ